MDSLNLGRLSLLQARALFRTAYAGSTLREHLGLTRPANLFQTDPHPYAEPRIW